MRVAIALAVLVLLAGCTAAPGGETPEVIERTVVVQADTPTPEVVERTVVVTRTVIVERTVTVVVTPSPTATPSPTPTPAPTPTPSPTATPAPDYGDSLDVDGEVTESDTEWQITWVLTNDADRAVWYDFDLLAHYTDDVGRNTQLVAAHASQEFAPGETRTYTETYDKNDTRDLWRDEGPRSPDVEVNEWEVR